MITFNNQNRNDQTFYTCIFTTKALMLINLIYGKKNFKRIDEIIIVVNHGKKIREKPFSRNFSRKIFSRNYFFVVLTPKICANIFVKKFSLKEKSISRNYLNDKIFRENFSRKF
jgi:hypothetical protein